MYAGKGAEGFAVITDESTIAGVLGEELDSVTVRLFSTRQARDDYVARVREQRAR